MSRKGECLDNAVAESFFGTLKNELIYYEDYRTRPDARQSVFEYIEVLYNRNRRHAFLNYMTHVEYEMKYVGIYIARFFGSSSDHGFQTCITDKQDFPWYGLINSIKGDCFMPRHPLIKKILENRISVTKNHEY